MGYGKRCTSLKKPLNRSKGAAGRRSAQPVSAKRNMLCTWCVYDAYILERTYKSVSVNSGQLVIDVWTASSRAARNDGRRKNLICRGLGFDSPSLLILENHSLLRKITFLWVAFSDLFEGHASTFNRDIKWNSFSGRFLKQSTWRIDL